MGAAGVKIAGWMNVTTALQEITGSMPAMLKKAKQDLTYVPSVKNTTYEGSF
jgi:hypothetical protein